MSLVPIIKATRLAPDAIPIWPLYWYGKGKIFENRPLFVPNRGCFGGCGTRTGNHRESPCYRSVTFGNDYPWQMGMLPFGNMTIFVSQEKSYKWQKLSVTKIVTKKVLTEPLKWGKVYSWVRETKLYKDKVTFTVTVRVSTHFLTTNHRRLGRKFGYLRQPPV